jgi:hypothetical protein
VAPSARHTDVVVVVSVSEGDVEGCASGNAGAGTESVACTVAEALGFDLVGVVSAIEIFAESDSAPAAGACATCGEAAAFETWGAGSSGGEVTANVTCGEGAAVISSASAAASAEASGGAEATWTAILSGPIASRAVATCSVSGRGEAAREVSARAGVRVTGSENGSAHVSASVSASANGTVTATVNATPGTLAQALARATDSASASVTECVLAQCVPTHSVD